MDKYFEEELKELLLKAEDVYHRLGDYIGRSDTDLTPRQEELLDHAEDVVDGMESTFENWSAST